MDTLGGGDIGIVVPIHKHPTKDESFVILRGKVRVTTHCDNGYIIEDVALSQDVDFVYPMHLNPNVR